MNSIEDFIPISALQHFVFCPRRAALIFTERLWCDNLYTVEGGVAHQRVHDIRQSENRKNVLAVRGMELVSNRWRLAGKADLVEFSYDEHQKLDSIAVVEYKRGKPKGKRDLPFRVQTCAQVLCLEDMLGRTVEQAFLYFAKARRRVELELDDELRQITTDAIRELRVLIQDRHTPRVGYQKRKCDACSLLSICVPQAIRPRATALKYLETLIDDSFEPGTEVSQ